MKSADDDAGVEVYLKPHDTEELQFLERPLRDESGGEKKTSAVFIQGGANSVHFIDVVVKFGRAYRLMAADGIQVAVKMGRGQPNSGQQNVEYPVIQKTWVCGQQHVFDSIGNTTFTAELSMKAMTRFGNPGSVEDGQPLAGTITIFVTRCRARWDDAINGNAIAETNPLLKKPLVAGSVVPVRGTKNSVFEFRPCDVQQAIGLDLVDLTLDVEDLNEDSGAALHNGAAVLLDQDFTTNRQNTATIRQNLHDVWAFNNANNATGRHRQLATPAPLAPLPSQKSLDASQKIEENPWTQEPKICTCKNHLRPENRGVGRKRENRASGDGRDAGDQDEGNATPRPQQRAQPNNADLISKVHACRGCRGAKVADKKRDAFKQQWKQKYHPQNPGNQAVNNDNNNNNNGFYEETIDGNHPLPNDINKRRTDRNRLVNAQDQINNFTLGNNDQQDDDEDEDDVVRPRRNNLRRNSPVSQDEEEQPVPARRNLLDDVDTPSIAHPATTPPAELNGSQYGDDSFQPQSVDQEAAIDEADNLDRSPRAKKQRRNQPSPIRPTPQKSEEEQQEVIVIDSDDEEGGEDMQDEDEEESSEDETAKALRAKELELARQRERRLELEHEELVRAQEAKKREKERKKKEKMGRRSSASVKREMEDGGE
jgi:hypothetical protein